MKLFGDTGKHLHAAQKPGRTVAPARQPAEKKPPEQPAAQQAAPERKPFALGEFFRSPIWRKLRAPAIVLGCIVLFFLLVLLVYSIWERPPEVSQEGPKVQPTVQPAVETFAPETAKPLAQPEETAQPGTEPETTPEPTEEPVATGRKDNCYTFVILANDQFLANTDTILVGRMDTDAGTLDVVHIPRDTLVNVSWGVKKINTVLVNERNDPERFLEHLGNLIGFTPDCYAVVNIRAVEKLVDCIGGVYYNVPRDMDYDDPTQDLHIHIPAGYQLLNGENAVKVLRFRVGNDNSGYANGDLGRIATQQSMLKTIAAQFLTLGNIPNLTSAIEIFQDNVTTNLTANNIAFFVREFLKMGTDSVRFHTMPGTLVSIRGGSYLQVVIDEWVDMVNDYLNPFLHVITADNLNILQDAGALGAVSTTGEELPLTSFFDFKQYLASLNQTE